MSDVFTTRQLGAIARQVFAPDQFLLNTFFPQVQTFTTKLIDFYTINEPELLAEFVAPNVSGVNVDTDEVLVDSYSPAYIRLSLTMEPCNFMERMPDEPLGGSRSPQDRQRLYFGQYAQKLDRMIQRRMEWMAAKVMFDGAITISGRKYPSRTIDFGRDAAHSIVLSGGNVWSDAASTPLQDLEDWSGLILGAIGVAGGDVIMTPDAYKLAISHQDFNDLLTAQRGVSNVPDIAPWLAARSIYKGPLGQFRLWVYDGQYTDAVGAKQRYLPANTVIVVADGESGLGGKQMYGAIQDNNSLIATPRYAYVYDEKNPSKRKMVMECAPLLAPTRANAIVVATVN